MPLERDGRLWKGAWWPGVRLIDLRFQLWQQYTVSLKRHLLRVV